MARPSTREDAQRRLALVAWVGQNPGVSLEQAAQRFGVPQETVRRDVEALWSAGRSDADSTQMLDFDAVAYDEGRLVLASSLSLDRPLRLTAQEVAALSVSLDTLAALVEGDSELVARVEHARDALERAGASRTSAAAEEPVPGGTTGAGWAAPDSGQGGRGAVVLAAVRRALTEGRRLRLEYVDGVDRLSQREVEPMELVAPDASSLSLRAWCLLAGGERSFRLDRVVSATVLPDPVVRRPGGAPRRSRRAHEGSRGHAEGCTARLHVAACGRWLAEQPYCDGVEEHADGTLTVRVRGWSRQWLVALVLGAGSCLLAVEPGWLAQQAAARARAALAVAPASSRMPALRLDSLSS